MDKHTRMIDLENGTKFYVMNGDWMGEIIFSVSGIKYIKNEYRTYEISDDYECIIHRINNGVLEITIL